MNKISEYLSYNPDTGQIKWIQQVSEKAPKTAPGNVAGCVDGKGYRVIGIFGRNYKAHRLAWFLFYGNWPQGEIDHINGDKDDNRITNLRDVSRAENAKNQKTYSSNSSGITGISWSKRNSKWKVHVRSNGRTEHVGYFESINDAAIARKLALESCGFHQNHGRAA